MFKCSFCGDQVESGAVQCPRCGIAIEWHEGEPRFADPGESVVLLKLYDPATQAHAESLLESAGIEYVIQGDVTQELLGAGRLIGGFNQVFGPPVIRVQRGLLEAAREAIAPVLEQVAVPPGDDELPYDEATPKPE